MKKIKILFLFATIFAFFFTSCSEDPSPIVQTDTEVIENLKNGILNGRLTEDFTLDAGVSYSLTNSFIIEDGATLNVPAGTQISANANGVDVYIAVLQGGKININGTTNNPVVMASASGNPGDWGGLTLCGRATTTAGVDATAEVGGFIYGGTTDNDSSGIIKGLVIRGTGAAINADSEYNGISFYAVGSGTIVENVAVIDGADDGVEFFGGTVSATNIYLENNEDDAIDWTEGWNGTVTNSYVLHTISNFSTVVEADKENGNPKLVNLTAVSTQGGTALQFKKQSGATITGLSLVGYDVTVDMADDGPLANVSIDGSTADPSLSYNAAATVDISLFAFANAQLTDIIDLSGDLTTTLTLDATKRYRLSSSYIVRAGGKLIIPAGTKISARAGGVDVYVAVLIDGEIEVQGTPSNPVVMSSVSGEPGDWGGLTICGKATTTAGVNAVAEVGGFIYGGTTDNDSSGSIKNLVIRGTGAAINSDSEYNGVSLYAVGSGTTIEDVAIDAAVNAWCAAGNGDPTGCAAFTGFHQYVLTNPGNDMNVYLPEFDQYVTLSAADLNYPKPVREYDGVTVELEKAWDGDWALRLAYTNSDTVGNYEGTVKSDNGQDDAGITQDFDQPGLVDGSYGKLPNHRKHIFKANGSKMLANNLVGGMNMSVTSPRYYGCIGEHPTDVYAAAYGASSWYCNGVLTPRGSVSQSAWVIQLDALLAWNPPVANGDLTLRMDVFNILDLDAITDINEYGEDGGGVGSIDTNYLRPTNYQTARRIRFGASWRF